MRTQYKGQMMPSNPLERKRKENSRRIEERDGERNDAGKLGSGSWRSVKWNKRGIRELNCLNRGGGGD